MEIYNKKTNFENFKYHYITSSNIAKVKKFILLHHNATCHYFSNHNECYVVDIDNLPENYYEVSKNHTIILDSIMLLKCFKNKHFFNFLEEIKTNEDKCIILHDIHDFSCATHNIPKYKSIKNSISLIINYFYIKTVVCLYDCPEYDSIVSALKNNIFELSFYTIGFPYDERYFKNYYLEKKNDILMYGNTDKSAYPFRHRLANIIKNKKLLHTSPEYTDTFFNEKLAQEINKSYITIATVSKYSYFVRKYMEISASFSCVAGNINYQGLKIFGDDIIYLSPEYTDDYITEKINYYLTNKELINEKINNAYQKIKHLNFKKYCNDIINFQKIKYLYKTTKEYLCMSKYIEHEKDCFFDYDIVENNDYLIIILDLHTNIENLKKMLNNTHNIILLIHDDYNYKKITKYITECNIKNIIFHSHNNYNKIIMENFPNINFFMVNHHVNTKIFKKIQCDKNNDIFLYFDEKEQNGENCENDINIKFCDRILRTTEKYTKIKYESFMSQEKIAEMINKSKYTIVIDNFLSKKFFEILLCESIIVGNIGYHEKKILKNNYVEFNEKMKNKNISNIFAENKKFENNNFKYTHTHDEYKLKIFDICNSIINKEYETKYEYKIYDLYKYR